jgi:hypothetical protein
MRSEIYSALSYFRQWRTSLKLLAGFVDHKKMELYFLKLSDAIEEFCNVDY